MNKIFGFVMKKARERTRLSMRVCTVWLRRKRVVLHFLLALTGPERLLRTARSLEVTRLVNLRSFIIKDQLTGRTQSTFLQQRDKHDLR